MVKLTTSLMSLFVIFMMGMCIAAVSAQSDTCQACNCQFNNVQVLDQLIRDKIAAVLENNGTPGAGGVTYTRWGSTSCSNSTGAQLVYAGRAAGSWFSQSGGGAEKICLPDDPDYLPGTTGLPSTESNIYGAEYEFGIGPLSIRNVWAYTPPCAICFVPTRATTIMVPAKSLCPPSWTREYYGYLTTESLHHHRSSFNCVDVNPEVVPGTGADSNGALFYFVSSTCTGIACPPYENGRILSCAVCTK